MSSQVKLGRPDERLDDEQLQWTELMKDMHRNLFQQQQTHSVIARDYSTKPAFQAAKTRRLRENVQLNRRLDAWDWSRGDQLYAMECYQRVCAEPAIVELALLTDVLQLSARVCLLGCRHTPMSRARSLKPADTRALELMVASWAVQFGSHTPDELTAELKLFPPPRVSRAIQQQLADVMDMEHLNSLLSEKDKKERAERRELQINEDAARAKALATGDEQLEALYQEEEDIEESSSKGDYWLTDLPICIVGLLPTAARIFHELDAQRLIVSRFPHVPDHIQSASNYLPSARDRLIALVKNRCATSAGDSFVPNFRDFVYLWYMPLGTLQQRHRSEQTSMVESSPAETLGEELGNEVAQAIFTLASVPALAIIEDPAHELYELLVFYTLDYLMRHECGVSVISDFTIQPSELSTRLADLDVTMRYRKPRRPYILFPMHRVVIQDQGRLYTSSGLIDAGLRWLMIMRYAECINDGDINAMDIDNAQRKQPLYNDAHGNGRLSIKRFSDLILADPKPVSADAWSAATPEEW